MKWYMFKKLPLKNWEDWSLWFAWYPVPIKRFNCGSVRMAWLEKVFRKQLIVRNPYPVEDSYYKYHYIEASQSLMEFLTEDTEG